MFALSICFLFVYLFFVILFFNIWSSFLFSPNYFKCEIFVLCVIYLFRLLLLFCVFYNGKRRNIFFGGVECTIFICERELTSLIFVLVLVGTRNDIWFMSWVLWTRLGMSFIGFVGGIPSFVEFDLVRSLTNLKLKWIQPNLRNHPYYMGHLSNL